MKSRVRRILRCTSALVGEVDRPQAGREGDFARTKLTVSGETPSPTLPHKGGGNVVEPLVAA